MNKYKAIIWDLDGTLLNTLDDLLDATNASLSEFSYPIRSADEVRAFVGNGIRRLIVLSLPGGDSNPDFEGVFEHFKKYYAENCRNKTCAYPGIMETLRELKKQEFKMAVVSNKIDFAVKELIEFYFPNIFDSAVGESENVRKKPFPDSVFAAMTQLGSTNNETLYIGDSEVDIQTAANAGIDCLSAAWGFRTEKQLIESGAKKIIRSPSEVLSAVEL